MASVVPCICVPSPVFLWSLLYGVCGELIGIYRKSSPGGSVIGQDFRLISSEKYAYSISWGRIFVDAFLQNQVSTILVHYRHMEDLSCYCAVSRRERRCRTLIRGIPWTASGGEGKCSSFHVSA